MGDLKVNGRGYAVVYGAGVKQPFLLSGDVRDINENSVMFRTNKVVLPYDLMFKTYVITDVENVFQNKKDADMFMEHLVNSPDAPLSVEPYDLRFGTVLDEIKYQNPRDFFLLDDFLASPDSSDVKSGMTVFVPFDKFTIACGRVMMEDGENAMIAAEKAFTVDREPARLASYREECREVPHIHDLEGQQFLSKSEKCFIVPLNDCYLSVGDCKAAMCGTSLADGLDEAVAELESKLEIDGVEL